MVSVAVAALSGSVPSVCEPSLKVTEPDGVSVFGEPVETVAVSVTGAP